MVYRLIHAIFPRPSPRDYLDTRYHTLVSYARKVEGDMYRAANSRSEYYFLLAEQMYKIQRELELRGVRRTQLDQHSLQIRQNAQLQRQQAREQVEYAREQLQEAQQQLQDAQLQQQQVQEQVQEQLREAQQHLLEAEQQLHDALLQEPYHFSEE